jgi:hypothetical protein
MILPEVMFTLRLEAAVTCNQDENAASRIRRSDESKCNFFLLDSNHVIRASRRNDGVQLRRISVDYPTNVLHRLGDSVSASLSGNSHRTTLPQATAVAEATCIR